MEEELICSKCGRRLDPDDCDLEDGKPVCVESCPLTEEEWQAEFGIEGLDK
jgi:hypothetical protein